MRVVTSIVTLDSSLSVPVIASVVGIFISCITLYYNRRQDRLNALVEGFKLLRMFHVPSSTFSRRVDNLTEEELSKFAVTIAMKDFVDIGLLLRGESTFTSFLHILERW
jgi:hypothetical protein